MENACICRKDVSESTISRFLNKEGYYYLQARKKGLLTKADMKKRRLFARKMQKEYYQENWTEDIAFYLDGTGSAYKRNPLDQALAPKASQNITSQFSTPTHAKLVLAGLLIDVS